MARFVKERPRPEAGSIPDLLRMFEREIRFYTEIAPEVGVRVPECFEAVESGEGFRLVLEDLSGWTQGADPEVVARLLSGMHRRWEREAAERWPWLDRGDRGADAIGALYDRTWADVERREDITPTVHRMGAGLVGRVAELEREENRPEHPTLIHGDATLRNVWTDDDEVAFVDWEDVRLADGAVDLAWLLVSSVAPDGWDGVIAAYGPAPEALRTAMPATVAQGVLSLADHEDGSETASGWLERLERAAAFVA